MIDFFLIVILAVVTWSVASEGAWGAVTTLFSVIFAGMLAMNFFEPTSAYVQGMLPRGTDWAMRADYFALIGIFTLLVFAFRALSVKIMPDILEIHPLLYDIVRWAAGLVTGYATMAILLTSLHTTAFPREFMNFTPERDNFLNIDSPDKRWLAFMQYTSENVFYKGAIFDGPRYSIQEEGEARVWPSFIIRYATRRDRSNGAMTNGPANPGGSIFDQAGGAKPGGAAPPPAANPGGGSPGF